MNLVGSIRGDAVLTDP